jgi:hypothetical protein
MCHPGRRQWSLADTDHLRYKFLQARVYVHACGRMAVDIPVGWPKALVSSPLSCSHSSSHIPFKDLGHGTAAMCKLK